MVTQRVIVINVLMATEAMVRRQRRISVRMVVMIAERKRIVSAPVVACRINIIVRATMFINVFKAPPRMAHHPKS